MLRRWLVVCLLAGCGAQLSGQPRGGGDDEQPDAATITPDAASPTPTDGSTGGFLAACMAKGYTSEPNLTSLYRIVGAGATWPDAEIACAGDVSGATHLIVLSNSVEVDFAVQHLGWVGLDDRATEGTFVNVTGEPNDQRPWRSGQPDNGSGNEDCVQLKSDGLDDDQCGNAHAYVCECDGRPPTP
jgi:hypothetical protein